MLASGGLIVVLLLNGNHEKTKENGKNTDGKKEDSTCNLITNV